MPLSDLFSAISRLFSKPTAPLPAVEEPSWLDLCEPLTQASEGCYLVAYPDPATKSVPYTIGWGSTGPDITSSTVWTQQEADNRLRTDLAKFGARVDSLVKVPVSAQQKAALVDFSYNVGSAALATSTLLKLLNAGNYEGAADQFPVWNLAAGRIMPGLVTRRARERSLFLTGSWK